MRDSREVSRNAIRLVTPTADMERSVGALARLLLLKTRRAAARFSETRGVLLGGSFAKGTWLPQQVDLDIFVRINPGTPEDRFEKIGLAVGAAATRGSPRGKKFAQHPYTEATVEGIRVNIVPCYSVRKGEWKSAADRSLFHVQVVRRLSAEGKTQIRLLKRFMMAVGVYGAEIETQGFSGYAAEVLVMRLGSFEGVLRYFTRFEPFSRERLFSLPDPVDGGRDLAIAISGEKLGRMILASRGFLRNPSGAYFRKMRGRNHPPLRGMVFAVVFSHRLLSEDTLWGELRKTTKHIVRHLEMNGFEDCPVDGSVRQQTVKRHTPHSRIRCPSSIRAARRPDGGQEEGLGSFHFVQQEGREARLGRRGGKGKAPSAPPIRQSRGPTRRRSPGKGWTDRGLRRARKRDEEERVSAHRPFVSSGGFSFEMAGRWNQRDCQRRARNPHVLTS